jgi:hypothetical protein
VSAGTGHRPQKFANVGAAAGACVAGGLGVLVGLVLGLVYYPPTAWAAAIEIGIPAAMLGSVVGLVIGAILDAARRPCRPHR